MSPLREFPPASQLVVDSMVFLHFSFVQRLDDFFTWLPSHLSVTPLVVKEVLKVSRENPAFGRLNLQSYIDKGLIHLEKMDSSEETLLFYGYYNQKFGRKKFGQGEASCLAVGLSKHYGIICDEREVLEEFKIGMKARKFESPAWNSWRVVDLAVQHGLISKKEGDAMKDGFLYG
jgi:hypothetical protein